LPENLTSYTPVSFRFTSIDFPLQPKPDTVRGPPRAAG
jgi:hypothetical protein